MKKLYTFLVLLFSQIIYSNAALPTEIGGVSVGANEWFVTTWNTNAGTHRGTAYPATSSIVFTGLGSNFTIYWESVSDPNVNGLITDASGEAVANPGTFTTINFPAAGEYKVYAHKGTGTFTGLAYNSRTNAYPNGNYYITAVNQMGTAAYTSINGAFYKNYKMDYLATDVPNIAGATNLSRLFQDCHSFVGNASLNNWNTENVTNTSDMFNNAPLFNQPIGSWNTAKVTNMNNMFSNAIAFNQDISGWNTQAVTTMNSMFSGATVFNQPIGSWNTSAVTNMGAMLTRALAFNQPIGTWNTSKVTSMGSMLNGAAKFNQNLGTWDLSALSTASRMLEGTGIDCINYSATLNGWANAATTPDNINMAQTYLIYNSTAETAHNTLTTTKGWTITGDTYTANCGITSNPVAWGHIFVITKGENVEIAWSTVAEHNNKGFYVEHSVNGYDFETVGKFVPAKASNGGGASYTVLHTGTIQGTNYYRIKQIDNDDNTIAYSEIKLIVLAEKITSAKVYPNPATTQITVVTESEVQVYDMSGRRVLIQSPVGGKAVLDISRLAKGVYLVKSKDVSSKFIKH